MSALVVLGSGSKGNCVAMCAEGEVLLIDAGFSAREIERRAEAAAVDLGRVSGIVITHEHGDHSCGAARLARRLRAPILATYGTWERLRPRLPDATHVPLALSVPLRVGPFEIEACRTSHDAAEPVAVAVRCGSGRIGVAYDLGRPTAAVRYLLRDLAALVLEANHDDVLLRTSDYPPAVRRRIMGSGGHLSNRAAAELARELVHPGLAHVVLAHLSERCNTAAEARGAVEPALRAAGFRGELHVALQDAPLRIRLERAAAPRAVGAAP